MPEKKTKRIHLMKTLFKNYYQLTKMGIVFFALLTACLAYLLSLDYFLQFSFEKFIIFILGLYLVCSGSFILNQAQEWALDQKMKRTQNRPIPLGKISPSQAYVLAFTFLIFGCGILFLLKPLTCSLAVLTVILYNGFYTLFWKKHLKYGAVLGALPGALPPVIGYSLGNSSIFDSPSVYLFFLLFFWQMPHFWSLAIHYKNDYKMAGLPILPTLAGREKTLYQMGFYMLAYVGLALISPLFLKTGLMYIVLLIPLVVILLYQFHKYFHNPSRWLTFFLWINASILICFAVPVFDKLIFNYFVTLKNSVAGF